jgi:hypothetical protein
METTQNRARPPQEPQSFPSRRNQRRARKFHASLSDEMFEDFIQPVTLGQVEQAIEFLDQNFGRWQKNTLRATADYVLPAIHKLFPEQRRFGFVAPFGPKQAPREGFGQWLDRYVFGGVIVSLSGARRESPHAR